MEIVQKILEKQIRQGATNEHEEEIREKTIEEDRLEESPQAVVSSGAFSERES